MKKISTILTLGILASLAGIAPAQSTDYTVRQVRDPVQMKNKLNTDMGNIESRVGVLEGSITTTAAQVTVGSLVTTGDLTIAEGKLADSTVVAADIKDGTIANADINANAAIAVTKLGTGGVIPANSAASLTNLPAAQLTGNAPAAALTNAMAATIMPAYLSGVFTVVESTQLVFIANNVTNVIDGDITH